MADPNQTASYGCSFFSRRISAAAARARAAARRRREGLINHRACGYFCQKQDKTTARSAETQFEDDFDFLDKIRLYRRNNIAHGQFIEIDINILRDMSERAIEMMRKFNNLVDNQVTLQGYRACLDPPNR